MGIGRVAGWGIAALAMAVAACGDADVTGVQPGRLAALLPVVEEEPQVVAEASARIGPKGGTLEVAGARLTVPAGALSRPTVLWLGVLDTGAVMVGPATVVFAIPAQLTYTTAAGVTVEVELEAIGGEVTIQGFILVGG